MSEKVRGPVVQPDRKEGIWHCEADYVIGFAVPVHVQLGPFPSVNIETIHPAYRHAFIHSVGEIQGAGLWLAVLNLRDGDTPARRAKHRKGDTPAAPPNSHGACGPWSRTAAISVVG